MSSGSGGGIRDAASVRLGAIPSRWMLVALAIALGILGEVLYAVSARPWLGTFSACLLFSLAALVAGSLFGFLFGLPHVEGSPSKSSSTPTSATGAASGAPAPNANESVAPSTNLQQIADWLTKLILGAGLTQLGRFPHASYVLFHGMAAAVGGSPSAGSTAITGAIAIYFAVLGFVVGWLATYFFLTPAMTRIEKSADALAEQSGILAAKAAVAQSRGQTDRAALLRSASQEQSESAKALYATVYSRTRRDPARVRSLDDAIAEAAQSELAADPAPVDVKVRYDTGTQRDREVALAVMAEDPSKVSADALVSSISNSRTAVEQYQALRAAAGAIGRLSPADANRVRAAADAEVASGEHFSRASARFEYAQQILDAVPPPASAGTPDASGGGS